MRLQIFTSLVLDQINDQAAMRKPEIKITLYERFLKQIFVEKLEDAWNLKPILNGKDVCTLFGKKSGPWMKGALEDVMEWQLEHPDGSKEEATDYIKGLADQNS